LLFFNLRRKIEKKLLVSNAIVKGNWYNIMNTMNEIITGAFDLEMKEFFCCEEQEMKTCERGFF
jgi:hypothetical protein